MQVNAYVSIKSAVKEAKVNEKAWFFCLRVYFQYKMWYAARVQAKILAKCH